MQLQFSISLVQFTLHASHRLYKKKKNPRSWLVCSCFIFLPVLTPSLLLCCVCSHGASRLWTCVWPPLYPSHPHTHLNPLMSFCTPWACLTAFTRMHHTSNFAEMHGGRVGVGQPLHRTRYPECRRWSYLLDWYPLPSFEFTNRVKIN